MIFFLIWLSDNFVRYFVYFICHSERIWLFYAIKQPDSFRMTQAFFFFFDTSIFFLFSQKLSKNPKISPTTPLFYLFYLSSTNTIHQKQSFPRVELSQDFLIYFLRNLRILYLRQI